MRFLFLCLLTAFAVLVEPILSSEVGNPTARPDVLLLPAIVALLVRPGWLAVVWGGLIGLVCDCLTGPCLGPQLAAFAILAAIGSVLSPRSKSLIAIFSISFGYVLAARTVSSTVHRALEALVPIFEPAGGQLLGSALSTAILVAAIWFAARQLSAPFSRRGLERERRPSFG
jgi:rod shape-determining protein MreD